MLTGTKTHMSKNIISHFLSSISTYTYFLNFREANILGIAFLLTGAAEACGGGTGKQQLHNPPLIFDLEREEAEESPLQFDTPEYEAVVQRVARKREELLWDIATDKSVSTADYSTDESAAPCCDPSQTVCRCHPTSQED